MSSVSDSELRKIAHAAILEAARKIMQATADELSGSRAADCYHDAFTELGYARENLSELRSRATDHTVPPPKRKKPAR